MHADEPAHVRGCSTASTPVCIVPGLLSLLKITKKYRGGDAHQPPPNIRHSNQGAPTRVKFGIEEEVGGWSGAAQAANDTISRYHSFYTSFQYKAGAYGAGTRTYTTRTLKITI